MSAPSSALATRPDDLRLAAQSLLIAQGELEELAARLAGVGSATAVGWQGVAALGHRAATERVQHAVLTRCGPVGEVAGALGLLAEQGAAAQRVVCVAQRALEQALAERHQQIAVLVTLVDPVEVESVRERIIFLDTVIHRAQDEITRAEDTLERGHQLVERVLQDSWLGERWEDLSDLVHASRALLPVRRGGGLVIVGSRLLLTSAELARELSPFARHLLEVKVVRLLKVVMKPPLPSLLMGSLGRFVIPVVVITDAWPDLLDGGGYASWRGFTLRVTAVLAIPGSVAMIMPHPIVAGIGAVTVGAYYLVKGGYVTYDHRLFLAAAGAVVWGKREEIRKAVEKVLSPHPAFPLGPLGPLVPIGGLDDVVPDLPGLGDLKRFVPGLGGPLPLPDVPIGPGLRLPVIPSPAVGGSMIVMPIVRRLF